MNPAESTCPKAADFKYRADYYNALTKWRYHNDIGPSGKTRVNAVNKARKNAYLAIEWVRAGCVDSFENLMDKTTGTLYVHPKHQVT